MFDQNPQSRPGEATVGMSPSQQGPPARQREGYFQCGLCKKHYNRADHLIRHVRSHTREKPYVCHVCNKAFARPDLMKRHAAGHDHDHGTKRKRPVSSSQDGRVSQACKACAASKLKCDEEKPCRRCRDKNLTCDWAQDDVIVDSSPELTSQQVHGPKDQSAHYFPQESQHAPVAFLPANATDSSSAHLQTQSTHRDISMGNFQSHEQMLPPAYDGKQTAFRGPGVCGQAQFPDNGTAGQMLTPTTDRESRVFSIDNAFSPGFISDSIILSFARLNEMDPALTSIPQEYAHPVSMGGTFDFNLDLTDVDFGFIDTLNAKGFAQGIHSNIQPPEQASHDRGDADRGIAIGADAYRRSSLSQWKPVHEDHAFADQESLSVPMVIDSPESSIPLDRQMLCERLSPSGRDLIFGMVLQTSRRKDMTRIMKSFPSTELLDSLIQYFFQFQRLQVDSWIHGPTFLPNSEDPDILAALAAAGATHSSIPAIRKLGYALMEIARLRMSFKFETDNSTTRELRALQTYALAIGIGIWSGNRRKTEICEALEQPLVTMLRRSLRFRRSAYSTITPNAEDTGEELERKWREWVEQESFKRLVYHSFLHDTEAAIMLNSNQLVSYAELELPMPVNRRLWEAKTASEWKQAYLALGPLNAERLPSLADALQDISQLSPVQKHIDSDLSALILLHGISSLIGEYHRLRFTSKGNSKHWHALVINSRHQELYQALQQFLMISREWHNPPRPEIFLFHEVACMFLHLSLEELQLFAGKEDKQEARRVYQRALEWINGPDSRRAVWHAGQAIRAAKAMPPGSLTGFFAVAVYHASLAFWSYGVVSKAKDSTTSSKVPVVGSSYHGTRLQPVFLDEQETAEVQKFISLGCGDPVLRGFQGEPVFVSDPNSTMQVPYAVLCADNNTPLDALPSLVQSLCQLMRDLGSAAKFEQSASTSTTTTV